MATKAQWRELLNLKLSGGDAPAQIESKYSIQEIELYLNMAFNDINYNSWMQDPSLVDDYVRDIILTVKYDSIRDERYVDITTGVLSLPGNAGVMQIRYKQNPNLQFSSNDITSAPIFSELEVSSINRRVGYYQEGKRVYFNENLPRMVEELLIKVITTFESLDEDDEVTVPGGNNMLVYDTVYKMMGKQAPSENQQNMVTKQV